MMILDYQKYVVVIAIVLFRTVYSDNELEQSEAKDFVRSGIKESRSRRQSIYSSYYFDNNNPAFLPRNNFDITIGNPLKGLIPGGTVHPSLWPRNLPASMTLFKWPLNSFMLEDPSIYGENAAFNWTFVESQLATVASFNVHAIIRFWIEWPGQSLRFPSYLLKSPYNLTLVNNNTALYYDDPVIKKAINQTIQAFARRYDGDSRIYAIQAGMFGAWGEWHSQGVTTIYNGTEVSTFPSKTADEAVPWYKEAFKKTHVQFRYPDRTIAFKLGFGYHDDSFTYTTLGGIYNGNVTRTSSFFWNTSQRFQTSDFWKNAPMGGEVRPTNGDQIFSPTYESYTPFKQDFGKCVEITHTSYMAWGRGWSLKNDSSRGVDGIELQNARNATVRTGYNFEIDSISVGESQIGQGAVDIAVTIKQTGVAPFYYNLNISLYCDGGKRYATSSVAIWNLLESGNTSISTLTNIPSTRRCLDAVDFRLESTYVYAGRPIRWAQGNNNGTVVMSIPSIPTRTPTASPTSVPTSAKPIRIPTAKPTWQPTSRRPVKRPISRPTKRPIAKATARPLKKPVSRPKRQLSTVSK